MTDAPLLVRAERERAIKDAVEFADKERLKIIIFGTFDVQFARNVPFEAAQAVAFGLPKEEALKALTINSEESWAWAAGWDRLRKGSRRI